jgi:hypothetical protein
MRTLGLLCFIVRHNASHPKQPIMCRRTSAATERDREICQPRREDGLPGTNEKATPQTDGVQMAALTEFKKRG